MALSVAAMIPAAIGLLTPTAGAVLQEVIDVAAIAIALTALLPTGTHTVALPKADLAVARQLYAQHAAIRPLVERVRGVADDLGATQPDLAAARRLVDELESDLLSHERAEKQQLLPILCATLNSRTSHETVNPVFVLGVCLANGDLSDLSRLTREEPLDPQTQRD